MDTAPTALSEQILGRGMRFGSELAGLDAESTSRDTRRAYNDFVSQFQQHQAQITRKPLQPGYTLSFHGPSIRDCGLRQLRLPNARPELQIRDDQSYSLTLQDCLRGGYEEWSQVWRCGLVGPGVPESTRVVLKLYQYSYFPEPPLDHFQFHYGSFGEKIEPAENFACREAAAYTRLSEQQGSLVPYCYGFHKFTLPCNEDVEGVILEEIDGVSCVDYISARATQNRMCMEDKDILISLALRVWDDGYLVFAAQYQVSHRDLGHGNILVLNSSKANPPDLVYIDFGRSFTPENIRPHKSFAEHTNHLLHPFIDGFRHVVMSELEDAVVQSISKHVKLREQPQTIVQ